MSDADRIRQMLTQLGLSQRGAARILEVSERTMRYYCSGKHKVPRYIMLAIGYLILRRDDSRPT